MEWLLNRKNRHTLIHYIIVILLALTQKTALIIFFSGIAFLGYLLFWRLVSPFHLIVSIALVSIGISMILINLWEIWASIVSSDYNLTHCPFCRSSKDPRKILSAKNGRST